MKSKTYQIVSNDELFLSTYHQIPCGLYNLIYVQDGEDTIFVTYKYNRIAVLQNKGLSLTIYRWVNARKM